ncbi:MAG: DUF3857 domain-containing protein [Candidatus Polarisedimenticolia bacterium]
MKLSRLWGGALVCLACAAAFAAEQERYSYRDTILSLASLPPLADADRTGPAPAVAKDAPAVVLLKTRQDEWLRRGALQVHRRIFFRRVKLLTSAGVEQYGSYKFELRDPLFHLEQVDARTVLPDGAVVDAAPNVRREASPQGYRMFTVSYPQAKPGAVLDLMYSVWTDNEDYGSLCQNPYVPPQWLSERLPVAEAHYVYKVPDGVAWRSEVRMVPLNTMSAGDVIVGRNDNLAGAPSRAYVWIFRDIAPIPVEPNAAPSEDMSAALYVVPINYPGVDRACLVPKTWKELSDAYDFSATVWERKKPTETRKLAREAAENLKTPLEKVEAVRAALASRVHVVQNGAPEMYNSADDTLAGGAASSIDVALTAMTMLREVGVEATPVFYRRRETGAQQPTLILFDLYNDVLLRIGTEKGPVFWAPASELLPGTLPFAARGVPAVVGDGKTKTPIGLPAPLATDNVVETRTTARLDASGALTAKTTFACRGDAAAVWRQALRGRSDVQRRELLKEFLGGTETAHADEQTLERQLRPQLAETLWGSVASAEVDAVEPGGPLDGVALDFSFVVSWRADAYAARVGGRLAFGVSPFHPVDAADWAASGRYNDVDLGAVRLLKDQIEIELPPGAANVQAPDAVAVEGQYGAFESSAKAEGGKLVVKRSLRLDQTAIPAEAWFAARPWFRSVAAADEAKALVSVGENR